MNGEQRRQFILTTLREGGQPITGAELARAAGVSRQVIVQDMAVLRAAGQSVIATPQGYLRLPEAASGAISAGSRPYRAVLASRHTREQVEEELNILVDHGVKVLDVVVEHAIYGELTGRLMVETREDARAFVQRLNEGPATLLADLTGGVHLHTVDAPSRVAFEAARDELARHGLLVDEAGGAAPRGDSAGHRMSVQ